MRWRTRFGLITPLLLMVLGCRGVVSNDAADAASEISGREGAACTQCLSGSLEWGGVGGLVFFTARSEVTPCRDFVFRRVYRGSNRTESCASAVPCTSAVQVDMSALIAALAHEDVVAAFEAAPVLLGLDTRPVDAPVFEISQGGPEHSGWRALFEGQRRLPRDSGWRRGAG